MSAIIIGALAIASLLLSYRAHGALHKVRAKSLQARVRYEMLALAEGRSRRRSAGNQRTRARLLTRPSHRQ